MEADGAAQGLHAVGQAGQAGTARGIGPADTVVADRQQQAAIDRGQRPFGIRKAGIRQTRLAGVAINHASGRRALWLTTCGRGSG